MCSLLATEIGNRRIGQRKEMALLVLIWRTHSAPSTVYLITCRCLPYILVASNVTIALGWWQATPVLPSIIRITLSKPKRLIVHLQAATLCASSHPMRASSYKRSRAGAYHHHLHFIQSSGHHPGVKTCRWQRRQSDMARLLRCKLLRWILSPTANRSKLTSITLQPALTRTSFLRARLLPLDRQICDNHVWKPCGSHL